MRFTPQAALVRPCSQFQGHNAFLNLIACRSLTWAVLTQVILGVINQSRERAATPDQHPQSQTDTKEEKKKKGILNLSDSLYAVPIV